MDSLEFKLLFYSLKQLKMQMSYLIHRKKRSASLRNNYVMGFYNFDNSTLPLKAMCNILVADATATC